MQTKEKGSHEECFVVEIRGKVMDAELSTITTLTTLTFSYICLRIVLTCSALTIVFLIVFCVCAICPSANFLFVCLFCFAFLFCFVLFEVPANGKAVIIDRYCISKLRHGLHTDSVNLTVMDEIFFPFPVRPITFSSP